MVSSRRRRVAYRRCLLLIPPIFVAASAAHLIAAPKSWPSTNNGNWSIPGNWSPSGVPVNGDDVTVNVAGTLNTTILYDYTGSALTLNSLILDNTKSSVFSPFAILSMSGNTLSAKSGILGNVGRGAISQSGGVANFLTTGLTLGSSQGAQGFYTLNGPGALNTQDLYVGLTGAGTFNQSAGTVTVNGTYYLAYNANSTSTYSLSGSGILNIQNNMYVGNNGNGTFTQAAGTVNLNASVGNVFVSSSGASTSAYNMSGGFLTAHGATDKIEVGNAGSDSFNQSGASNVNIAVVDLGYTASGTGVYNLSDGDGSGLSPSLTANAENVGASGPGVFTQIGSTNHTNFLTLGGSAPGAYTMSPGVVSAPLLSAASNELIGDGSSATMNQSAGVNSIAGQLLMGVTAAGSGSYNLSGTGQLSVGGGEVIGQQALGVFTQTGGANVITGTHSLMIGDAASGTGYYFLSGDNSLLSVSGDEFLGNHGEGFFTQLGGTHLINGNFLLAASTGAFAFAQYQLVGGSLIVNGGTEIVGYFAPAIFYQQGGTHIVSGFGALEIGTTTAASSGTYYLINGTLTSPLIYVSSHGSFGYTGGSLNISHLDIEGGSASFNVATATRLDALTFGGAANSWQGQLDLHGSPLILEAASAGDKLAKVAALTNQILSGKNGGAWNGQGITSSAAQGNANTTLALADNADLGLTTFRGQAVDGDSLIVVQARFGDANLDGAVNSLDLTIVANHWQQGGNALWSAGDFNGDGAVNSLDLTTIANNWQAHGPALQAGIADFAGGLSVSGSAAPVPEPASLALLALALPLVGRRGSRRRRVG